MHRGYVKAYRKLFESDMWLKEPFTRGQAWVDLIGLANHTDGFIRKRGIRINLKRGEVGWGERELAERWKWSRGKVRRFLTELCSENEQKLVPQTEPQNKNVISCYLIINYDLYQSNDTTEKPTSRTTNGPQTGHKRYQNKNEKNEKNTIYLQTFSLFWKNYPKKEAKKKAWQAWLKIGDPEAVIEKMKVVLPVQMESEQWTKENGTYIPMPTTYINQERWEDEIHE